MATQKNALRTAIVQLLNHFETSKWYKLATEYFLQNRKMHSLLGLAAHLFRHKAFLPVLQQLLLLWLYLTDIIKGRYKGYNLKRAIFVTALILYAVSPIDIVPDAFPLVGYLDDATLISIGFTMARSELNRYYTWRKKYRASIKTDNIH